MFQSDSAVLEDRLSSSPFQISANLHFVSIGYPGDPPFQSLAGTRVYAKDGTLHLGNKTRASVEPECHRCTQDTVIYVDGDTGKAYLVRTSASWESEAHDAVALVGSIAKPAVHRPEILRSRLHEERFAPAEGRHHHELYARGGQPQRLDDFSCFLR